MLLKLVIYLLHFALLVISVVLAIVFGAICWFICLLTLPFRGRGQQPNSESLKTYELPSEITINKLIPPEAERMIDAVFEGGGVKALAQVGAIQAIEKLDIKWNLLGGTSGGAVVASILAAGKSSQGTEKDSEKMWRLLTEIGLHSFVDVWYLPRVAFLQKRIYFYLPLFAHLMFGKGLVSGRKFLTTMERLLQIKENKDLRFKDLLNPEYKDGSNKPRHTLKMVATDISRGTPVVFPDDLHYYWEAWDQAKKGLIEETLAKRSSKPARLPTQKDAQDWWPVAKAVRMSMSIPFFFEPVSMHLNVDEDGNILKDRMGQKGQRVLIVDGGVSSNFPIWLFDHYEKPPRRPTFGFLLDEKKGTPTKSSRVTGFLVDMAASIINTGMGAMGKRLCPHDESRTARLSTMGVKTTEFGLSTTRQLELVRSGHSDTISFLKDKFIWPNYLEEYRRH